jgi:hypothetical protein
VAFISILFVAEGKVNPTYTFVGVDHDVPLNVLVFMIPEAPSLVYIVVPVFSIHIEFCVVVNPDDIAELVCVAVI